MLDLLTVSRAKIYAARVSPGSSSCRSISAGGTRPQQQTRQPPLLLSINGTDRQTDGRTDGQTPFMTLTAYYKPTDRVTNQP